MEKNISLDYIRICEEIINDYNEYLKMMYELETLFSSEKVLKKFALGCRDAFIKERSVTSAYLLCQMIIYLLNNNKEEIVELIYKYVDKNGLLYFAENSLDYYYYEKLAREYFEIRVNNSSKFDRKVYENIFSSFNQLVEIVINQDDEYLYRNYFMEELISSLAEMYADGFGTNQDLNKAIEVLNLYGNISFGKKYSYLGQLYKQGYNYLLKALKLGEHYVIDNFIKAIEFDYGYQVSDRAKKMFDLVKDKLYNDYLNIHRINSKVFYLVVSTIFSYDSFPKSFPELYSKVIEILDFREEEEDIDLKEYEIDSEELEQKLIEIFNKYEDIDIDNLKEIRENLEKEKIQEIEYATDLEQIEQLDIIEDTIEEIEPTEQLEIIEDEYSDYEKNINIYLEHEICKQVKDRRLEEDLNKLIVKINKDLSLNSLGFKKYNGLDEKIYGLDFSNSQNTGERIIACFLNDYIGKNEFSFEKEDNLQNKDKSMILFCISSHEEQNENAKKIAHRISRDFYSESKFEEYGNKDKVNVESNNMTFNLVDFVNGKFIYKDVLTKAQSNNIDTFIKNSNPFILQGIAGSGKTLSTLNLLPDIKRKFDADGEINGKVLYVTFSRSLKRYVEDIIEKTYSDISYLQIKTFDELCMDIYNKYNETKINGASIITQNISKKGFDKFLEFLLKENKNKKIKKFLNEKNKELIYSEIFGILKGSMYINWDRKAKNLVSKDAYMNDQKIASDYKIFSGKDREIIYLIAQKYNTWLKENQYYDINDLAFSLYDEIKNNNIGYEYVIVDEVQDFTEVQIYMLFLLAKEYKLNVTSNTKRIFLAGDPNQVINPTFFKVGRLTTLFHLNKYGFENEVLHENFRNSKNIMSINNAVNEIINEKLPARKIEEQQEEILKNNKSGIVNIVKNSEDNLKIIIEGIKDSPKVALIVSDEDKKNEIKSKYGYNNAFTITEIKGREFENIIEYNILSDNANIYEKIYEEANENGKAKEAHFSYYFNMFYVAITRANYNLVLIEEKNTQFLSEIKDRLDYKVGYINALKTFDDLNLDEMTGTSLEFLELGLEFLYDEDFERAKVYLSRSEEKDARDYLKICNSILNLKDPNDDFEKYKIFFVSKKYRFAQLYLDKSQRDNDFAALLCLYIEDLPIKAREQKFLKYIKEKELDLNKISEKYMYEKGYLMRFLKECEDEDFYSMLNENLLKRIANEGNAGAIYKLSKKYYELEDYEMALLYELKLADSKYEENYKEDIMTLYKNCDDIEAMDLFSKIKLAIELYLGRIIDADKQKAIKILEIANKEGSILANQFLNFINKY